MNTTKQKQTLYSYKWQIFLPHSYATNKDIGEVITLVKSPVTSLSMGGSETTKIPLVLLTLCMGLEAYSEHVNVLRDSTMSFSPSVESCLNSYLVMRTQSLKSWISSEVRIMQTTALQLPENHAFVSLMVHISCSRTSEFYSDVQQVTHKADTVKALARAAGSTGG